MSNVWGSDSNCSKVFEGCAFDAYFHHPMTLHAFTLRKNKIKAFMKHIPNMNSNSEMGYCDEVLDIVNHNFNIQPFKKYWPLRDNCTIGDAFQIQVDIEKQCFNMSSFEFEFGDNTDDKCQKMNDIVSVEYHNLYLRYSKNISISDRLHF